MMRRATPPDALVMAVLMIAAVIFGIGLGYWIFAALT